MMNSRLMAAVAVLCAGLAIPAWAGSTHATATVTQNVGTTTGATGNAGAIASATNVGLAAGFSASAGGQTSAITTQADVSATQVNVVTGSKGSTAHGSAHASGFAGSAAWATP